MSSFIILVTDFGCSFYVGQMKGVIKKINPKAEVIDLCHDIESQNIIQASVVIGSSYRYFPEGTIFVCVIDPTVGSDRDILILKTQDYIFLAPNNGILTTVINKNKKFHIFKVYNDKFFLHPTSNTFHGRDIFSPVAAYLSMDLNYLKEICQPYYKTKLKIIKDLFPKKERFYGTNRLIGKAIFYDKFGNIVTNFDTSVYKNLKKSKLIQIFHNDELIKEVAIKKSYFEVKQGEFIAYVNSFGYLEVAINCGNAYEYLNSNGYKLEKLKFLVI